jgi:hypothetical protein
MRRNEPSMFESIVLMVDKMMMMMRRMMRWARFWCCGGASRMTNSLGNQYMAEPEYKPSMMERMFVMFRKVALFIFVIYLVIYFLYSNFSTYGDLKSQSLETFQRRVHYYNLEEQLNGIATLLPVHFFSRFVKLDIIELIECKWKHNERACYSAARRTCIAKYTSKNKAVMFGKIVGKVENVIIDADA